MGWGAQFKRGCVQFRGKPCEWSSEMGAFLSKEALYNPGGGK